MPSIRRPAGPGFLHNCDGVPAEQVTQTNQQNQQRRGQPQPTAPAWHLQGHADPAHHHGHHAAQHAVGKNATKIEQAGRPEHFAAARGGGHGAQPPGDPAAHAKAVTTAQQTCQQRGAQHR
jgi:hypothetical protein